MAGGNIPAVQRPWFVAASRATGVPANVLAGIASVESNIGANASTSSAGAQGEMQFEPGTAAQFHLNPYNTPQAILDAGKLLLQYGYRQNPLRAIGAYNGGPGNPQYGYANQVMAEARRLASQIGGGGQGAGALPQMSGSGSPTTRVSSNLSVPVTTFDKQGFQQAQRANVLGNFLSQTARNDPWGDGGAAGFAPLFAAGKATMSTPDPAQFFQTGTRSVKVISAAQANLQKVAGGGTQLAAHPATITGSAKPKIPYLGTTLAPIQTMTRYFGPQAAASQQVTVNFAGHPVQVNRALAANVQALGQAIQRAGLAGQIHDIGGFRTSVGASGSPIPYSMHQFGAAIDVNEGSQNWHTMSVNPRMIALFKQFGWFWGGNWGGVSRDGGHFQFMGGL